MGEEEWNIVVTVPLIRCVTLGVESKVTMSVPAIQADSPGQAECSIHGLLLPRGGREGPGVNVAVACSPISCGLLR